MTTAGVVKQHFTTRNAFESPKVRAEPHGSLLDTRDRVAPPIKDLTPTQSVPPITNIPTPNSQIHLILKLFRQAIIHRK